MCGGVFAQIDSKRAAFLSGQDLHVQRQVCPVILGEERKKKQMAFSHKLYTYNTFFQERWPHGYNYRPQASTKDKIVLLSRSLLL